MLTKVNSQDRGGILFLHSIAAGELTIRWYEELTVRMQASRMRTFVTATMLLTVGASLGMADSTSLTLGTLNLKNYTGPSATVTVNRTDSRHATLTFTSLVNSEHIYPIGAIGIVGANINGTFQITSISGSGQNGFTSGTVTEAANCSERFSHFCTIDAANEDEFGRFNLMAKAAEGSKESDTQIVVSIQGTGATAWTNAADVLTGNNKGNVVTAHVFTCPGNASACTSTQSTAARAYPSSVVPEPRLLTALAVGMIGLALFQARRKSISNN